MPPDLARSDARSLNELWLASLQTLTAHVAHDLKGALNGVSVNLEVVRSRAERPGTPISDVQKFSVAAVDQLAIVIRMTGALLALSRVSRGVADVSLIAKQMGSLLEDTLRSDGANIAIRIDGGLSAPTAAVTTAVRLALAEVLAAAALTKRDVSVRIQALPVPRVDVAPLGGTVPSEVVQALAGAGIILKTDGHGISIVFPGPDELSTEGV